LEPFFACLRRICCRDAPDLPMTYPAATTAEHRWSEGRILGAKRNPKQIQNKSKKTWQELMDSETSPED